MSILDVWEQKAVAFTRKTREKAQALSETTRLNSLIAGEDKNYHSLCTQIGEQYVKLHRLDYEPEFEELMTLCQASLDRTQDYREQIMGLKKVRCCPSCGAEVPRDFVYCNFCGARLPEVEPVVPDGFVRCPGCGAVIPDSMKFCNHCGTLQTSSREAAQPESAPEAAPVQEQETESGILSQDAPPEPPGADPADQ